MAKNSYIFKVARKRKLKRFNDLNTFPNVVQNYSYKSPVLEHLQKPLLNWQGTWKAAFFKNNNPLVVELACGKGDYTLALAQANGNKNFLGVDIKGNRIWKGASAALEKGILNAGFLRTKIELLPHFFAYDEIAEFWITFPDPFPKSENRRLTAPHFLEKYRRISAKNTRVHFKTDDAELMEYTLSIIEAQKLNIHSLSMDIDKDGLRSNELSILTFYEQQHLAKGRKIKYVCFEL